MRLAYNIKKLIKLANYYDAIGNHTDADAITLVAKNILAKSKGKLPEYKGSEKGGHKTPPKNYPRKRSKYADPANYKYPLDTKEHVRAALRYIKMPRNRKQYTAEELKAIESRIQAAARKFGIGEYSKKNK